MRRLIASLALFSFACASQPPPRQAPAARPAQSKADSDYVGPVWFDPAGKKVVRKQDQKTGKIAIDHKFAAEIWVDGQRVASAPYAGELELVAGSHRLTIQEPGCEARHLDITVPEGISALPINTIGPCLPPGSIPPVASAGDPRAMGGGGGADPQQLVYRQETNTPAWIVTGVSIALAVAGSVFVGTHVAAANKRDDLIAEDPNRFDARPVRKADNEAFAWSIAASASFGAAAIALGTAIVMFVTNTGEAPPDYNFGAGASSLTFDLGF
jgi:hypothetical protein